MWKGICRSGKSLFLRAQNVGWDPVTGLNETTGESYAFDPYLYMQRQHSYALDACQHLQHHHSKACGKATRLRLPPAAKPCQLPPAYGPLLAPAPAQYSWRTVFIVPTLLPSSITTVCHQRSSCPRYSPGKPCPTATPSAFALLGPSICFRSLCLPYH